MPVAEFRFYEELNDFLAPEQRKRAFARDCAPGATVKHVIEALGVPHTEVDLILVNGESVGFSRPIRDGDRVSVYPPFESFDITPLLRLRPEPLRVTRFLADGHLGGLARYLRMLGFDTLLRKEQTAEEVIEIAVSEHRIVLTRNRRLLMRRAVTHGCLVRAQAPFLQCGEIVDRLQLRGQARPFRRCLRCNGLLEEAGEDIVASRVDAATRARFQRFRICGCCGRVYWEGSHYRRMERLVETLLGPS